MSGPVTCLALVLAALCAPPAELGMGLRVGEVSQTRALVWVRLTARAERAPGGHREPKKREPRSREYVPSPVPVSAREGEMLGAPGLVRLRVARAGSPDEPSLTEWATAVPEHDFVHQFELSALEPGTRYEITAEIKSEPDGEARVPDHATASFRTPASPEVWQDARFTVVTGQSYWDLDHPDGFHIYPAMAALEPDFVVLTGDTVYLDNEAPRARTLELARYHWHRMYSLPRLIDFHASVPGYWEVDDHDTWCDDDWPGMQADWMSPLSFEQGYEVFREQVPLGDEPYRTIRWGKGLQVWLVEGRLFRSPNNAPDGPEKSIWGATQREWLKRSILASDATFKVLVSPTPIVGPDRSKKADNHANEAFAWEGDHFRAWTREHALDNLFVCCGDRHWQYLSIDPASGLREICCGPASDAHAGGSPRHDPEVQPFHRQKGGFASVSVTREDDVPTIAFRHHDVHGEVVNELVLPAGD